MQHAKHFHSTPLVSRLDHLDFIMKYLEEKQKQNLPGLGNKTLVESQCKSLDLAVREAYSKGSLLDRVASLEHKLFQLCIEMESSGTWRSTSSQTSGDTSSSSQGFKRELSTSFPTFNNPNLRPKLESQVFVNRLEIQGKSQRGQQRPKQQTALRQQLGKKKSNMEEKSCKSKKKGLTHNWPHLKILGC